MNGIDGMDRIGLVGGLVGFSSLLGSSWRDGWTDGTGLDSRSTYLSGID